MHFATRRACISVGVTFCDCETVVSCDCVPYTLWSEHEVTSESKCALPSTCLTQSHPLFLTSESASSVIPLEPGALAWQWQPARRQRQQVSERERESTSHPLI